jgi:YD repeat-containing protein
MSPGISVSVRDFFVWSCAVSEEVNVIKRIVLVVFAVIVLQFVFSSPSAAQSPNPCVGTTIWYFPDPIPFGWWIYGGGQGSYSYTIGAWTCAPPNAGNETCPFCPRGGSPISLVTGNTFIEETDVKIPGLGGGLTLVRTWNSGWPASLATFQSGIFGSGWRSTYEERIILGPDYYIKYLRGDGSVWSFKFAPNGSVRSWVVAAPANIAATLSTDTNSVTYYTLTFQNGEQRRFDATTGNLIAIIDRNGNTTTVGYDSSGRLSTVTDAASRHLNFTYVGGSALSTGVTTDFGVSLSYSYDNQARLIQIIKPDLTTISFAYSGASELITTVTDSNGKVLESHTYDSKSRGLTSSRAGGVEALTITYPTP